MSIQIIDTVRSLGNFPVAVFTEIDCNGLRLDAVLNKSALELSYKANKTYVDDTFLKKDEIPKVPTKTSQLENDSGFLTEHQSLADYALKEEIPVVPSLISAFTNDLGYVRSNDERLTNSRPASDVYEWAKSPDKPKYTKSEVGLSKVDNTSDIEKPISAAAQAEINLLKNYVTPEMFGAVGDGLTDDSAAFAEAMTYKNVLLISSYNVGAITINENDIVVNSTSIENKIKGSVLIKGKNSVFSNITFDGLGGDYAIKLEYEQPLIQYDCSFRFNNIRVTNAKKGVDIASSARNVIFSGCSFYSCETYCVYDVGTDNHYSDCAFYNCQTGLFIYNNSLITASTFYDLSTGININHNYNNISNCDFQQSNVAIYCTGSNNNITNIAIENMSLTSEKDGLGIYLYNASHNNVVASINADAGRIHGGLEYAVRILGINSKGNNVTVTITGSYKNDIPDAITTTNYILINGIELKRPVEIATIKSNESTTPYTKTGGETEYMMVAIGCAGGLGSFMYIRTSVNLVYRIQITNDYFLEVTVNNTSIYVSKSSGIASAKIFNIY